ncbi:MAG: hypothetical protein MUP47_11425 [Phycisphaerae bacterium]|nr:hypothetical protein [Phycisphaerae bacterium]
MPIGNNDDLQVDNYGDYVVCLIDVLGQKDKLKQWARRTEDGQITGESRNAVKQSVGPLVKFTKDFLDYFHQLRTHPPSDLIANLPEEQQKEYHRLRQRCAAAVETERFSDTFVFSSPIQSDHGDYAVSGLCDVLGACCTAMVLSLADGTPVRGGITIGVGGLLEDKSFYGPALAEADHLQREVAGGPRVIVSKCVLDFLRRENPLYSFDKKVQAIMEGLASLCHSLLCQDVDGNWIVDFIGQGAREVSPESAPDFVQKGYDFVRGAAVRFRQEGNAKLAVRYYLLQHYIESRLPLWGLQAGRNES